MILVGRPENKETFQATLNYKPVEREQCELRMLIKGLRVHGLWEVSEQMKAEGEVAKLRTHNTGHRRA